MLLAPLHEGGLTLQDRKCLLQALHFSFAATLAGFISLGLCNATLLDLPIVLEDSRKFRTCGFPVTRKLSQCLVQRFELFRLVFYILLLDGLSDLVGLGSPLILNLSIRLR